MGVRCLLLGHCAAPGPRARAPACLCVRRVTLALSRREFASLVIAHLTELSPSQFAHGTEMAELLLKTGSRQLVEGNTWNDDYWCARHCLQLDGRVQRLVMVRLEGVRPGLPGMSAQQRTVAKSSLVRATSSRRARLRLPHFTALMKHVTKRGAGVSCNLVLHESCPLHVDWLWLASCLADSQARNYTFAGPQDLNARPGTLQDMRLRASQFTHTHTRVSQLYSLAAAPPLGA